MNMSMTMDVSKALKKCDRISSVVRQNRSEICNEYAKIYAEEAFRFTPPGNCRQSAVKAVRALKERIKSDLIGDTTEGALRWIHVGGYGSQQQLVAYTPSGRAAGPFVTLETGAKSAKALRALQVGKYGVEFVRNPQEWMAEHPDNYKLVLRGKTWHLRWHGKRHVTSTRALTEEIARRQKKAGQLMAGWSPLAGATGARVPAAVRKQTGHGTVRRMETGDSSVIRATNDTGYYPALQSIVDRQRAAVHRKAARGVRRNIKKMKEEVGQV